MYAIGGGAGSRLVMATSSTSPISPASRRRFSAAKVGRSGAGSRSGRGSGPPPPQPGTSRRGPRSRSTGFSQKIAFRAAAARRMSAACVSVDEAIATACTAASEKIPIEIGDGRAQRFASELARGLGHSVADVLESHARLAGEVASVDLADPAGADQAMSTIRILLVCGARSGALTARFSEVSPALYEIPGRMETGFV